MAATAEQSNNEIENIVAALASRQAASTEKGRVLSGPERAAVFMLALGEQYGGKVWNLLDDEELRQLSITMSTLGTVDASAVEGLLLEFVSRLSATGALPMLARFIRTLLTTLDLQSSTVILTSDHGNIEDLSVRNHTLNPVPTIVWGRHREHIASRVRSLTDITPTIVDVITKGTATDGESGEADFALASS